MIAAPFRPFTWVVWAKASREVSIRITVLAAREEEACARAAAKLTGLGITTPAGTRWRANAASARPV